MSSTSQALAPNVARLRVRMQSADIAVVRHDTQPEYGRRRPAIRARAIGAGDRGRSDGRADWRRCRPSTSSPCATSGASTRPTGRCCEGINLSFFPGAKIGVIGANGSGKSSLLRIMAGLDDGFTGEARLTPGFTVGLPAAGAGPRSRTRTSPATSPTGWRRSRACWSASTRCARRWESRTPTSTSCWPSRPSCRTASTPPGPGISTASSRSPWTPCGFRPPTPGGDPLRR